MTVYYNKERQRWRYHFQRLGKRYTGYCLDREGEPVRTRTAAVSAEHRVREALGKSGSAEEALPGAYTFAQAMALYASHAERLSSWPTVRPQIAELLTWFGPATPVSDITPAKVEDYVAWARKQPIRIWVGGPRAQKTPRPSRRPVWKDADKLRSDSTIASYLAVLSAALRRAHRIHADKVPPPPAMPKIRRPDDLPNPFTDAHLEAILDAAPQHLRDLIVIAVHTGMRLQEALQLRPDQVDLAGRVIRLDSSTKGRRGRAVFVNERSFQVLARLLGERAALAREFGKLPDRVVLYRQKGKGAPRGISSVKSAWSSALTRAGLDGRYTFHDTRDSFCSYLAERQVPLFDIQRLAGHASPQTTLRYTKAAEERLREAVTSLETKPHTKSAHGRRSKRAKAS